MISLSTFMVLRALINSALLGAASGAVFSLKFVFLHLMRIKNRSDERLRNVYCKKYGMGSFFADFGFFLTIGILYLLVNYIACDGVLALFPIACLCVSFMTAVFLIKRCFDKRDR